MYKKRNDKSKWLAQAGYSIKNWQILENDLRNQILPLDVKSSEKTQFGQLYEITGSLIGPNGKEIFVKTIWMTEIHTDITKFITMYPYKEKKNEIRTI